VVVKPDAGGTFSNRFKAVFFGSVLRAADVVEAAV
jgi:hypothetical protein